jgi:hypothetical protein
MRQTIKIFVWIAGLIFSLQTAWGYSLGGPIGNGGDAWQTPVIDFGVGDDNMAPKNIGEEYRRNTPVMYYTFDDNFIGYFGSNGTNAVAGAFEVLNNLTNVDSYSSGLTEFPLQSESINFQAQALELVDLKSLTLPLLMEQLGLADAVRYNWVIHSRFLPTGTTCPAGEEYLVTERNFDIINSPLNQLQYSPYINDALYTYTIIEDCTGINPLAETVPLPVDPLNDNPPVASGIGDDSLPAGGFYTGLTRDDVAGLRYLLQAANVNTESPAAGSLVQATTVGAESLLTTSNLTSLATAALTNDPVTLVGLFPGLVVANSTFYFTNIVSPNIITYTTNIIGAPVGTPPKVVTVTNGFTQTAATNFITTFANVVTNSFQSNSVVTLATTTVGLKTGSTIGSPFVTNTTTKTIVLTNVPSGDFYVIPAGTCGFNILQKFQTNVFATTNLIVSSTNSSGASTTQIAITRFTNHVYVVQQVLCPFVAPTAAKYEGIENIKFVGIDYNQYDSLLGQFYVPITNNYTMSLYNSTNGVVTIQNFQRVVTTPDFLFSATDQTSANGVQFEGSRTAPNFNQANILKGLAGPGTIDPSTTITFNKSGPVFVNENPTFLNGSNLGSGFIYGSFDGTTNDPVVYPNGTSIADLETEVFIQISPSTLPVATTGSPYSATFSVTGGQAPYTWSLATNSAVLPAGLTLSSTGVLSGTPTQNGVYDFVVQLNDSAEHIVRVNYFITIN